MGHELVSVLFSVATAFIILIELIITALIILVELISVSFSLSRRATASAPRVAHELVSVLALLQNIIILQ